MHKAARILSALGTVVPLLLIAGVLAVMGMAAPKDFDDLAGTCTSQMREVVGSPCWSIPAPVAGGDAALAEAAQIAGLTVGMECWDPSTGRLGSHVVVRSEAGVELLPFTQDVWDAAVAGEFETMKACEVA